MSGLGDGFDPFAAMASGVAGLFSTPEPTVATAPISVETAAPTTNPIVVAPPVQATSTRKSSSNSNDDNDDDDDDDNTKTSTRSSSRFTVSFQSPTSASATLVRATSVKGPGTSSSTTISSETSIAGTTSAANTAQIPGIPGPAQTSKATASSNKGSDVPRLPATQSSGSQVTPVGYAVGAVLGVAVFGCLLFILYKRYGRSCLTRRSSSKNGGLDSDDAEASAGFTGGAAPILPRKDTKYKSKTKARQLDDNESIDEVYGEKMEAAATAAAKAGHEKPGIRVSKSFTRFSFGLDQLTDHVKSPSHSVNPPSPNPATPGLQPPYTSSSPFTSTQSLSRAPDSHEPFSPQVGIATTTSLTPIPPSTLQQPQLVRKPSLRQQTTIVSPLGLPTSSVPPTSNNVLTTSPFPLPTTTSNLSIPKPPPTTQIKRKMIGGSTATAAPGAGPGGGMMVKSSSSPQSPPPGGTALSTADAGAGAHAYTWAVETR